MSDNYSELLEYLKKKKPKNILLISFEDSEIIKVLHENFSGDIKILSKTDFIGSGLKEILRKTRDKLYDCCIISNINSQVNRTNISIKLLAFTSKSSFQFIYFDEVDSIRTTKLKLLFDILPKIIIGIILAIYVFIKAHLFFYVIYLLKIKRKHSDKNQNKLILFLRTDLAGKIVAGGSLTHIKGFISGAKQLGFETIYVGDFPLINHPISIVVKPNHFLDFFDEIQMLDYHFRIIKKLRKCMKGLQIGAIYQRHSVFNASGVILSSILNVPIILEVNHSEVWVKKNWSRLVFEKLATRIENFAFLNSDLVGVVSDVTKEQLIQLGANKSKIVVNPNGVNPEKFSPDISGDRIKEQFRLNNFFVVGFIGTFTRWHGVETLFDAAVEVLSKNDKIKFLFIGDGNLKSVLELKTEQLKLDDKIIFTGIIPHEKAPEFLAACDVLVSPHLGFDNGERFFGSPTKLFEYMAMGKPIIASDLEQIGQIIKHKINGLKFKPGNAEELARLILELQSNKELCDKLGKKAREDVLESFTWEKNAKRILENFFDLNLF